MGDSLDILQQKSHQTNKYLCSTPCKILGTILKMVMKGTHKNEAKDKEIDH